MVIVYCCDVGSVKTGAFGWVRACRVEGRTVVKGNSHIDDLVRLLKKDIDEGKRIAIGMEAPLFIPVPTRSRDLSCGRDGEKDRSCFAPTGGYVATLGLHETAYIFGQLRGVPSRFTLDWARWNSEFLAEDVLIWEAFVNGDAHTQTGNHC